MEDSNSKKSLSEDEIWELLTRHERLGEILLKNNKITLDVLEDLIIEQQKSHRPLGEIILEKRIMTQADIMAALTLQQKSDMVINETYRKLKQDKNSD